MNDGYSPEEIELLKEECKEEGTNFEIQFKYQIQKELT